MLETAVAEDVESVVAELTEGFNNLLRDIDSYDEFKSGNVKIDAFYDETELKTKELCIRLREYSAAYVQLVLSGEGTEKEKYDALGQIYTVIYDGARDEIYDEIYDGLLNGIYDGIYDGVLNKAYGVVPYGRWRETRKEEYDRWSSTRKKIYGYWADTGAEIYEFWSGVRGEVADENIDKANQKLQSFYQKIEGLYETDAESAAE